MPYCSNCGSLFKFGIDRCPNCGEDLPQLKSLEKENSSSHLFKEQNKNNSFEKTPPAAIGKRLAAGGIDFFIGIFVMIFIIRIVL
jgi:uncharacterized membrane protein YvbJ